MPVYTAAQLAAINHDFAVDAKYVLMANIDLKEVNWTPLSVDIDDANDFIFKGNNHTITGLKIVSADNNGVGLFGTIEANNVTFDGIKVLTAEINLPLSETAAGVTTDKSKSNIGALVGELIAHSNATFHNVDVNKDAAKTIGYTNVAKVNSNKPAGGFNIGGLIGKVTKGTVTFDGIKVKADIKGYYNLGGLIGTTAGNVTTKRGIIVKGSSFAVTADDNLFGAVNRAADAAGDNLLAGTVGRFIGNATAAAQIDVQDFDNSTDIDGTFDIEALKFKFNYSGNTTAPNVLKEFAGSEYQLVGYSTLTNADNMLIWKYNGQLNNPAGKYYNNLVSNQIHIHKL